MVENRACPGGIEGDYKIGPGVLQGSQIPVQPRAAKDFNIGPEFPAVDGEEDIHLVIMGGDDDGGGLIKAGLSQVFQFSGIAHHRTGNGAGLFLVLFNQGVGNLFLREALCRGTSHTPTSNDDHFLPICAFLPLGIEVPVVGGKL